MSSHRGSWWPSSGYPVGGVWAAWLGSGSALALPLVQGCVALGLSSVPRERPVGRFHERLHVKPGVC